MSFFKASLIACVLVLFLIIRICIGTGLQRTVFPGGNQRLRSGRLFHLGGGIQGQKKNFSMNGKAPNGALCLKSI